MADEKKGITVKIDADLHAEIKEYLERHEGMTMAEFITLAVDDVLHPKIQQKEGKDMGNKVHQRRSINRQTAKTRIFVILQPIKQQYRTESESVLVHIQVSLPEQYAVYRQAAV